MSKNRVIPFGIGKVMITLNTDELPKDVVTRLIELTKGREKYNITNDTKTVCIIGDIMPVSDRSI